MKLTKLRRKADRLVLEFYTQGLCQACGKVPAQTCHHFVPKSQSNNLRYDPKNLVPICNACHFAHHTKGDPEIHRAIERLRGSDWADDLQKRRRILCKFNIGYLENIIEELTK